MKKRNDAPAPPREAFSPAEAAAALGVGVVTVYKLLHEGRLVRVKLGRRTLIPTASLRALVDSASKGPEAA